jgi:hypothetical protein
MIITPLDICARYGNGESLSAIANDLGMNWQAVRYFFLKRRGITRNHKDSGILAGPKISKKTKGKNRGPKSLQTRQKMAEARRGKGKGVSLKPSGYIEITMREHKGKREHRVIIERHLGRPLLADEVVHHKDGDKTNNELSNLEVMTPSAHSILHRKERSYTAEWKAQKSAEMKALYAVGLHPFCAIHKRRRKECLL